MQACRSYGRRPGHDLQSSEGPQGVREVSSSAAAADLLLQLLRRPRTWRHMYVRSSSNSTFVAAICRRDVEQQVAHQTTKRWRVNMACICCGLSIFEWNCTTCSEFVVDFRFVLDLSYSMYSCTAFCTAIDKKSKQVELGLLSVTLRRNGVKRGSSPTSMGCTG